MLPIEEDSAAVPSSPTKSPKRSSSVSKTNALLAAAGQVPPEGDWLGGVTLCVSGLPKGERERAIASVCKGGGTYSGTLHKGCTHLAVVAPEVRR